VGKNVGKDLRKYGWEIMGNKCMQKIYGQTRKGRQMKNKMNKSGNKLPRKLCRNLNEGTAVDDFFSTFW